jgi:hypothetical protein
MPQISAWWWCDAFSNTLLQTLNMVAQQSRMAPAKEKMVTQKSPICASLMKMAAWQWTIFLVEKENAVQQSRDGAVRRIEHGVAIDMLFRPKVDFDAARQLGNYTDQQNKLRRGNQVIVLAERTIVAQQSSDCAGWKKRSIGGSSLTTISKCAKVDGVDNWGWWRPMQSTGEANGSNELEAGDIAGQG